MTLKLLHVFLNQKGEFDHVNLQTTCKFTKSYISFVERTTRSKTTSQSFWQLQQSYEKPGKILTELFKQIQRSSKLSTHMVVLTNP